MDAGIGRPSEAAEAMKIGAAAVLLNTAIASASDPVQMAEAFGLAVRAERLAFTAKCGETKQYADATMEQPAKGFLTADVELRPYTL